MSPAALGSDSGVAASMLLPTVVVVGMLTMDVGGDVHSLMAIQHVAMFPAMLVAMLLRREEYGGAHAHA